MVRLRVRRGRALSRPLQWNSCSEPGEGRGPDRAAGADKAAWARPSSSPGVPGEEKQPTPTPDLVEVEVGSTAFLKCGPAHSSGNVSQVEWFLVSAWTLEGSSLCEATVSWVGSSSLLSLPSDSQGEADTHFPCAPGQGPE